MKFQSVDEAITCIEQRRFVTKGLDNFKAYMRTLNNPQYAVSCIHIAGTNGKGSTLNYLRSIFQEAGYQVGTFSSPYLETHFDRIRVQDKNIDKDFFYKIVNKHYEDWIRYGLNMFEIDFCIATLYFRSRNIDIAIYETGLGGKKDATNIVFPEVSIITNIGMDHCELLGNTLPEIAHEKAGIIKASIPLVTCEKNPHCLRIFQEACKRVNTSLKRVDHWRELSYQGGVSFEYDEQVYELKKTPRYQINNICTAIKTIEVMRNKGWNITDANIKKGIQHAQWKGRFEVMHENPLVIVDGAHNKEGIDALCDSLKDYQKIHVIFSALRDKDSDHMLERLLEISNDITVCEFESYRASTCEELAKAYPVKMETSFKKAIDEAMRKEGTIVITGSLYFISDVRTYIIETYTNNE